MLVVTDGPKADEVVKAQWIEQVEEAAAAVEELDPRDRKRPRSRRSRGGYKLDARRWR